MVAMKERQIRVGTPLNLSLEGHPIATIFRRRTKGIETVTLSLDFAYHFYLRMARIMPADASHLANAIGMASK
jgi:hypothetical protein